jgi:predicted ArsR family transcriptional regulator
VKNTRQRIIDYLESKPLSSAVQIAHALQVTPANIRHHIGILQDEGVVEEAGSVPPSGPGRPSSLFTLTQIAREHNLEKLTSALLEELLEGKMTAERNAILERIASRLASSSTLPHRLFETVQRLDKLHYHARWEAHAEAPRIILGHCPYRATIADHPELCLLDQRLLSSMLDVPVVQLEKLSRDERGAVHCIFALQKQESIE